MTAWRRTSSPPRPQGPDSTVEQHTLGVWINDTSARNAKLTAQQIEQLEAPGVTWKATVPCRARAAR
ncbi:hypothetical protein GCM10010193_68110 [Kitasatospora atroaurantiaca]